MPSGELSAFDRAVDAIESELALVSGDTARVTAACTELRRFRCDWTLPESERRLADLAARCAIGSGDARTPVVEILHDAIDESPKPWLLLAPLLQSRDPVRRDGALDHLAQLAATGRIEIDDGLIDSLATLVESGSGLLREPPALHRIRAAVAAHRSVENVYLSSAWPASRRLAARLLDLSSVLPPPDLVVRLLGQDLADFLASYLAYTRATHLDVLDLTAGTSTALLQSFRRAEHCCGTALFREIAGEIGWASMNAGIDVSPCAGVSVDGSFPLVLRPAEAAFVAACGPTRAVFTRFLIVAHGACAGQAAGRAADIEAVARFRASNLRHAEMLPAFLDVAPLTYERVRALLCQMDRAVEDFVALFGAQHEEGVDIADVYARLKGEIERELASSSPERPLGATATRLVQMFEDPASPAGIRTLHGCKRYLHQRGLRLGFGLVERAPGTNRAVTLAIASADHVLQVQRAIEFVDFEPPPGQPVPYVVRAAVDAFARHMAHGLDRFPRLRIFCYGNEVHCFAAFRNHPAFIRVDTSPPQRGGMIDLEYCGVSKYELEYHPNVSLTAIERVFRRIDFDVQIKDTRIHARYDKERAADLCDLSEKIDDVFRLVPVLMDVDWIIGDLKLSDQARADVAGAWADFFKQWGVLPAPHVLTADRLGILLGEDPDPAGEGELRWPGTGPYRDVFTVGAPREFWRRAECALAALGIDPQSRAADDQPVTARRVETHVLAPLRRAVARGELKETDAAYVPVAAACFRRRHEATVFATILGAPDVTVAASARLAALAALLEPALRFDTTGALNGYAVERAAVPLLDEAITLYVLRDGTGIPRLALLGGDVLCETRQAPDDEWRQHWSVDAVALAGVLRRANFSVTWLDPGRDDTAAMASAVRRQFAIPGERRETACTSGERLLRGVKASPGRAVGPARLGVSGRQPADLEDAVLVVPALTPDDQPFVFRSAAVVTTAGGILSHAGLLALQFHKPALVVAGTWERPEEGAPALGYSSRAVRETKARIDAYEIDEWRAVEAQDDRIADGDLLVVDGDAGIVRNLGQECDVLALHDELHHLAVASRALDIASADDEFLAMRGRVLRARHQLGRLLSRITQPSIARHAANELLIGEVGREHAISHAIKAGLLQTLLDNPAARDAARAAVQAMHADVQRRFTASEAQALRDVPLARTPLDVLALRLQAARAREMAGDVADLLGACRLAHPPTRHWPARDDIDERTVATLQALRLKQARAARHAAARDARAPRLRHRIGLLERIDNVLQPRAGEGPDIDRLRARIKADDEAAVRALAGARVLGPDDGGLELWPLAGSKAANLGEARRLGLAHLVPPWFVVTDRAFRDVLDAGPEPTLHQSIESILAQPGIPDAQKARAIRGAWEAVELPADLAVDIAAAYDTLRRDDDDGAPFVAVRSSAREEDLDVASRAGEFDTFLFVRGLEAVARHLKLAWSGLWNERALHGRAVLGSRTEIGGGVLIQRMVDSRASGVLHTVNLADGRLDETVINAGLGLGEGIVSGAVAADLIVVSKRESLAARQLRFRYITNDKRERVVFDAHFGSGTVRADTLYQQRLRPAIEYVELCELVKAASRLEWAYGQPLDIEFAFEQARLRLLQIRPLPGAAAIWRATADRYPLGIETGRGAPRPAIAG